MLKFHHFAFLPVNYFYIVPDLNPFFALLPIVFIYLILPVPYPFLPLTFNPQPSSFKNFYLLYYKKNL